MKSLETDAEIHADGSVTLLSPLPSWLKPGRAHVLLVVDSGNGAGSGSGASSAKESITPQPGCLKGFWMAENFDEPLEEFEEYMK